MNMVALHTIVYDLDDDFFDCAPPCAGHVEDVELEELLLGDDGLESNSGSSSSLGYWESMGDSEREFRWRPEFGDDSWLFNKPLYTEKGKVGLEGEVGVKEES
ncbi:hypothetical protein PM082_004876 [Marasmius tenuissimus]|nr:hypothetical protein PM082_004876 [Marasmius tenuissimus]